MKTSSDVIDEAYDFVEIKPIGEVEDRPPRFIEVYTIVVKSQLCSVLVKWLAQQTPLSRLIPNERDQTVFVKLGETSTQSSRCEMDISHLKRVRKFHVNVTTDPVSLTEQVNKKSSPDQKRLKVSETSNTQRNAKLQILLGPVSSLDEIDLQVDNPSAAQRTKLDSLLNKMNTFLSSVALQRKNKKEKNKVDDEVDSQNHTLTTTIHRADILKETVPGRLADSEDEWKEFNSIWPVQYFPNKSKEFIEQDQQLSQAEVEKFTIGMEAAINDAVKLSSIDLSGTVIMDPASGSIVSTASGEYALQQKLFDDQENGTSEQKLDQNYLPHINPLFSSVIFACQGVSRNERQMAIQKGMNSESFQRGQYLCTGYDVFTTEEPSTFEAMALVHSRINRLVFGCSSTSLKPHSGGILDMQVHALPGTNHRFRAFVCRTDSKIWKRCRELKVQVGNHKDEKI